MAEQSKRGSQIESGDHGHGGKKARAQVMSHAVVKQEQQEVGEVEEEPEEGEVSRGSGDGAGAMVPVEATETEPQINLRFGLTLFHCRACLLPLKPPTFKASLLLLISSCVSAKLMQKICLQEKKN
jgi:hypothetical protein